MAVIAAGCLTGLLLRLRKSREPLAGAVALVQVPLLQELVCVAVVQIQPLGLNVGSMRTADVGALVPYDVHAGKRVFELILGVRD